jgi:hypothetical protein
VKAYFQKGPCKKTKLKNPDFLSDLTTFSGVFYLVYCLASLKHLFSKFIGQISYFMVEAFFEKDPWEISIAVFASLNLFQENVWF